MTEPPASAPIEKVLVVDDDPTTRLVLRRVVEGVGGLPFLVADAEQARRAAAEHEFTCALIDKNLPGEDGLSLLKWLRGAQPDCCPMIVTGYGNLDSAVEAIRLGAFDYVLKPFELDVLGHRIRLVLERKRLLAEQEKMRGLLLRADRLASLGTLATGVVHEMSNALAVLVSDVDLLESQVPLLRAQLAQAAAPSSAEQFQEVGLAVREMRSCTDRMALLARDIKTFSRADDTRTTRVDLRVVMEAVLRMVWPRLKDRARLTVEYARVPSVQAADGRLAQVFLNLLINAVQAVADDAAAAEVRVCLRTAVDGAALVEIADTGSGIAPEVLPKLFSPYFTTKPVGVGTGLGLSICRSILEDLGGRIEVESRLGAGALFRVVLPAAPEEGASSTSRPRLLVVAQSPLLAATLRRLLWEGSDLVAVDQPKGALSRLRAGETFDRIFCEFGRAGVTAADLVRDLAQLAPDLSERVRLVASGPIRAAADQALVERRKAHCLLMPYDDAALAAWLARALD